MNTVVRDGSTAFAVWLTGMPSSGKSTIARALGRELFARRLDAAILESDVLRRILTPQATYSDQERETFYRALAYVGSLLVAHGVPVIFDATANRSKYRGYARALIRRFVEVYVDAPIELCVSRDAKGVYRKARAGEATTVPGVQVRYERPEHPELTVSGAEPPDVAAQRIVEWLEQCGYIRHAAASVH